MDLKQYFDLQLQLDRRIEFEHGIQNEDLKEKKILALFVELGELANETRCFKFWSSKPPSSHSVIAEEYVDGLHFILSLGIEYEFTNIEVNIIDRSDSLVSLFMQAFQCIEQFRQQPTQKNYLELMMVYLQLGFSLGLSQEVIFQSYLNKNQVNHERQTGGY